MKRFFALAFALGALAVGGCAAVPAEAPEAEVVDGEWAVLSSRDDHSWCRISAHPTRRGWRAEVVASTRQYEVYVALTSRRVQARAIESWGAGLPVAPEAEEALVRRVFAEACLAHPLSDFARKVLAKASE